MGNAGSASGEKGGEKATPTEFVLKVAMHCRCDGCTPKVSSALSNLELAPGVVKVLGRSATEDTEEVRLLATAEPERLRKSLHEATGKKVVDLVVIPPKPGKQERSGRGSGGKEDPRLVDFAVVQGLFADPQFHDQAPPPGHPRYAPPAPSYYPGPPPPAWVPIPYGHPFPAQEDKRVDLVFPPPKPVEKNPVSGGSSQKEDPRLADQPPSPGRRRQYVGHGAAAALAENNNHQHHQQQPGRGAADGAYPPAPAWGEYAYPTQATPPPSYYWPPNAPPCPVGLDYN